MPQKHEEYLDFLTYLMIHAAAANNEIAEEEKELIRKKVSDVEFEETYQLYQSHGDNERKDYLDKMTAKWIHSEDQKITIMGKIRDVLIADHSIDDMEKKLYNRLKDILA